MGKLFLIPTPIGNLADFTFRAVDILKEVDTVLAEDTRTSSILLKHYHIEKPLSAFHQHNEHRITGRLVQRIKAGETMALLTDAGTPGVSDPGFLLVRACIREDISIECLPGATAFVPALVNSGIPMSSFVFEGFLPHKKGRNKRLTKLQEEESTLIFYESPQRLVKTLAQFIDTFGADRACCVSRELTKIHEENKRGTLKEVHDYFASKKVKGEIVIIVEGKN